jgi:hypothetical protein
MTYLTDGKRHLICIPYSIENLHEMAKDLNIARSWYHAGKFPHYDIPKKRMHEIATRCKIVSSKEIVTIIKASIVQK